MASFGDMVGGVGIDFSGMQQVFSYFILIAVGLFMAFIIFFLIRFSSYRKRIIVSKLTANGDYVWFDKGKIVSGKSGQPDQLEFFWSGKKIPIPDFKNIYMSTPSWLAMLYGGGETIFLHQKGSDAFEPLVKRESPNPGAYFEIIPQDTEAIRLAEEKRILADYAPDRSFWEIWGHLIIIILTLLACFGMLGILAYSIGNMQSQTTAQLKEISTTLVEIFKSKNLIG